MAGRLEAVLQTIYEQHPHHILPYVGAAFEEPSRDRLRVMAIGINAYVSPADWDRIEPAWFRTWFTNGEYRFYRAIRRAATTVATKLCERGRMFEGMTFDGETAFYVTNAIKVYVPEATGKRSSALVDEDFERHREQWHRELLALHHHGAFPHVIIVFGAPFWESAWRAVHPAGPLAAELGVSRFEPGRGTLLHYLNRASRAAHDTLLVRLRHPASRTKIGSVTWLAGDQYFADCVRV